MGMKFLKEDIEVEEVIEKKDNSEDEKEHTHQTKDGSITLIATEDTTDNNEKSVTISKSVADRAEELKKEAMNGSDEVITKDKLYGFVTQAYDEQFEDNKDEVDTPEKVLNECKEKVLYFDTVTHKQKAVPKFAKYIEEIDNGKIIEVNQLYKRVQILGRAVQLCFQRKKNNKQVYNSLTSSEFALDMYFDIKNKKYILLDNIDGLIDYIREHREKLLKVKSALKIKTPVSYMYRYNNRWFYVDILQHECSKNDKAGSCFIDVNVYLKDDMHNIFRYATCKIEDYQLIHTLDEEILKLARKAGEKIPEGITEDSPLYYYNHNKVSDVAWLSCFTAFLMTEGSLEGIVVDEDTRVVSIPALEVQKKVEEVEKEEVTVSEATEEDENLITKEAEHMRKSVEVLKAKMIDKELVDKSDIDIPDETVDKINSAVQQFNDVIEQLNKITKKTNTTEDTEEVKTEEAPVEEQTTEESSKEEENNEEALPDNTTLDSLETIKEKIRQNAKSFDNRFKLGKNKGSLTSLIDRIDKCEFKKGKDLFTALNLIMKSTNMKAIRVRHLFNYYSSVYRAIELNIKTYYALSNSVFRYDDERFALPRIQNNAEDWFTVGGTLNIPTPEYWVVLFDNKWYFVSTDEFKEVEYDGMMANFYTPLEDILSLKADVTLYKFAFLYTLDEDKIKVLRKSYKLPENITAETPVFLKNNIDEVSDIQLALFTCVYMKYNRTYNRSSNTIITGIDTVETKEVVRNGNREIVLYLPKEEDEATTEHRKGSHSPKSEHERKGHMVHKKNGTVYYRKGSTVNKGKGKKSCRYKVK